VSMYTQAGRNGNRETRCNDIISLSELWTPDKDRCTRLLSKCHTHTCYTNPRIPNNNGRAYGVTCVFVRNELLPYIIHVFYSLTDSVILPVSCALFNTGKGLPVTITDRRAIVLSP
jgi:hypothetical protein